MNHHHAPGRWTIEPRSAPEDFWIGAAQPLGQAERCHGFGGIMWFTFFPWRRMIVFSSWAQIPGSLGKHLALAAMEFHFRRQYLTTTE